MVAAGRRPGAPQEERLFSCHLLGEQIAGQHNVVDRANRGNDEAFRHAVLLSAFEQKFAEHWLERQATRVLAMLREAIIEAEAEAVDCLQASAFVETNFIFSA